MLNKMILTNRQTLLLPALSPIIHNHGKQPLDPKRNVRLLHLGFSQIQQLEAFPVPADLKIEILEDSVSW
jgi:hypothetical protein